VAKKNFTKADNAIDKLFSQGKDEHTQDTYDTHVTQHTQHTPITQHTQPTHDTPITQHTHTTQHTYKDRGKRAERFGLLLDERLKEDLKHLTMATGSKSINDYIVTILLSFVEREENQKKLKQYRKLLRE
jgi:hypothetical protein